MLNTAAHEFVHVAFHNTLKQDPAAQRVLGQELIDIINNDSDVTYTKKGEEIFHDYGEEYWESRNGETEDSQEESKQSYKGIEESFQPTRKAS